MWLMMVAQEFLLDTPLPLSRHLSISLSPLGHKTAAVSPHLYLHTILRRERRKEKLKRWYGYQDPEKLSINFLVYISVPASSGQGSHKVN